MVAPRPLKLSVLVAQMGELLVSVGVGLGNTVTFATALLVQPGALTTVRLYAPFIETLAFGMMGF